MHWCSSSQAPVLVELLVALGFGSLGQCLCFLPLASPPTSPHPLSSHIPNLHRHLATEHKPHPKRKSWPLFQGPSLLHALYSPLFFTSGMCFCSSWEGPRQLPARVGSWPGPIHPKHWLRPWVPSWPFPWGLGFFLSGPSKPRPMYTQGYLQICHEQGPQPQVGWSRMAQVPLSLSVLA